ncbi:MAG: MFS transporter [Candidatus Cardinium sp.]|nr:MFS transporter [Candidatus Cardinium sp.]
MNTLTKKIIMLALCLILFIDGLGISIVLPLFSEMFLDLHKSILSPSTSIQTRNILYAASLIGFSLGMFIGSPILGELSDKYGRKRILLLSLIGTFVGYCLSGGGVVLKSPFMFLLGRIIDGLTAGSIPIAQAAMNDMSREDKKVGNMGLTLFAVTAGYIIGPLVAKFLSQSNKWANFGLETPFFVTALLSLCSILFLCLFKDQKPQNVDKKINLLTSLAPFNVLEKIGDAKIILIALFFYQLGWTLFFQYLPYFLSAADYSKEIAKILSLIGGGMAISFCLLTKTFQKIFTPILGSIISVCIISLSIFMQVLRSESITSIYILSFIASLGYGLGYSFLLVYLSQNVDNTMQGLSMGLAASMSALSSAITALLGSFLVNVSGLFTYIVSGFFFVICLMTLCIRMSILTKKCIYSGK